MLTRYSCFFSACLPSSSAPARQRNTSRRWRRQLSLISRREASAIGSRQVILLPNFISIMTETDFLWHGAGALQRSHGHWVGTPLFAGCWVCGSSSWLPSPVRYCSFTCYVSADNLQVSSFLAWNGCAGCCSLLQWWHLGFRAWISYCQGRSFPHHYLPEST